MGEVKSIIKNTYAGHIAIIVALIILASSLGYWIYLYNKQGQLIFHPHKLSLRKLKEIEKTYPNSLFIIKTKTGKIQGFQLHNELYKPLIIFLGGNREKAHQFLYLFDKLKDYHIIIPNYPGYGLSTGKPTQKDIFDTALIVYDYFTKKYKPKKIFVIGRSLGTSPAVYLAYKRHVDALCLITPFDSIESLAKEQYPFVPVTLLLKYPFNTMKYAKHVKIPCLFILASNDTTVPRKHSLRLIHAWKGKKKIIILPHTTHSNIMDHNKITDYIIKFLRYYLSN